VPLHLLRGAPSRIKRPAMISPPSEAGVEDLVVIINDADQT
jgi:hypothetical protein